VADDPRWLGDEEQRAWRAFLNVQARLQRRLNRRLLRETGLSDAEYGVLVALSEAPDGRLRVFQLREEMQWEKSRLTHQVTRMTERGLVERQPCPDDPRGAFVALTGPGRAAIEAAAPRHVTHVRRWFVDVLTPEQLAALGAISDTVLAALDADDPDEPDITRP
jgi:DNA-binding MarR family transcriptional regulator